MQAKITALANTHRRVQLLTSFNGLPTLSQAPLNNVAVESREQAHARYLSQCGRGAGSYLTARPSNGLEMQPWHMTMALRRHVGFWTRMQTVSAPTTVSENERPKARRRRQT